MARSSRRHLNRNRTGEKVAIGLVLGIVVLSVIASAVAAHPVVAALVVLGIIAAGIGYARYRQVSRRAAIHRWAEQAQHLGDLLTVSGGEFEGITADLFRVMGYRDVQRIGGSGDLGVDLTAIDPAGVPVIIQCKRYGRGQKVGSPAVQSLMGAVVHRGAGRGIFVTTSSFTAPAIEHARSGRVAITLIDGDTLTQMAANASAPAIRA